ncbi:MAG: hypothetical protein PsegKO_06940 [Pseudohongiellaceae bacterium]
MPTPDLSPRNIHFHGLLHALRQARMPALIATVICLVPLTAMQLTYEVDWTGVDFVAAFALLFCSGFVYNLLVHRINMTAYKLATALTLFTAVLLVFLNGAVGFVGSENNAINLIFPGVLMVLAVGVFVAAFAPSAMARALLATGLAQAAAAAIVLLAGGHQLPGASVSEILGLTAVFVVLWLAAGYFYRRTAIASLETTSRQ